MKILFVCTGNTCRSPMAEGIFRKMIEEHGKEDQLYCMSAGLAASDGAAATENAVKVCKEIGVDLSKHKARSLQGLRNLGAFDVFAVMTSTHGYVLQQAGIPQDRIYVLEGGIPDPYGGDEQVYRACRDRLTEALRILYQLAGQRIRKGMTVQKIDIVPMDQIHIPRIAQLEQICFSQPWSEAGLQAELTDPTAYFVTALTKEGAVAGYAGMHSVCGEGYIANVAVFPEARSQGIGRALVCALIEQARAQKLEFLSLEVRPSNARAVALYRSEGFREMGRRKQFYSSPTEDGLILTRFFQEG